MHKAPHTQSICALRSGVFGSGFQNDPNVLHSCKGLCDPFGVGALKSTWFTASEMSCFTGAWKGSPFTAFNSSVASLVSKLGKPPILRLTFSGVYIDIVWASRRGFVALS